MRKLLAVALLLLAAPCYAVVVNCYVATTGSDTAPAGDGTISKPWATINKADDSCTLGSTGTIINVAPGTYAPTGSSGTVFITLDTLAGTSTKQVIYRCTTPRACKIQTTSTQSSMHTFIAVREDFVTIEGFEITGYAMQGIYFYQTQGFRAINNWIHDTNTGCQQFGLASLGVGIDIVGNGNFTPRRAYNNQMTGNLIHDIAYTCAAVHDGYAIYVGYGLDDPADPGSAQQPGTALASALTIVANNIMYNTVSYGLQLYHNPQNILVANNTILNSRIISSIVCGGLAEGSYLGECDHVTIENNILGQNYGYYDMTKIPPVRTPGYGIGIRWNNQVRNVTVRNNLFWANSGVDIATTGDADANIVVTNSVNANPLFTAFASSGTAGEINYRVFGDFSLSGTSSPAYNTGVTDALITDDYLGVSRPQAVSYDRGAYEYSTGAATPTNTFTPSQTSTSTRTATRTNTLTPSRTFTATATPVGTIAATNTPTRTPTSAQTLTPSRTPTITPTPSAPLTTTYGLRYCAVTSPSAVVPDATALAGAYVTSITADSGLISCTMTFPRGGVWYGWVRVKPVGDPSEAFGSVYIDMDNSVPNCQVDGDSTCTQIFDTSEQLEPCTAPQGGSTCDPTLFLADAWAWNRINDRSGTCGECTGPGTRKEFTISGGAAPSNHTFTIRNRGLSANGSVKLDSVVFTQDLSYVPVDPVPTPTPNYSVSGPTHRHPCGFKTGGKHWVVTHKHPPAVMDPNHTHDLCGVPIK